MNLKSIIDNIFYASAKCGIIKLRKLVSTKKIKGAVWYNKECIESKKQLLLALRKLRNTNSNMENQIKQSECVLEYMRAKQNYRNVMKNTQKNFYSELEYKLRNSKNGKEFYKAINYFRNRNSGSTSVQVPIENFKNFFKDVFKANLEDNSDGRNSEIIYIDELDKDFTITELNTAIKKLSKN